MLVDAHILATPVLADLDGDGQEELIASVSYYFDQYAPLLSSLLSLSISLPSSAYTLSSFAC